MRVRLLVVPYDSGQRLRRMGRGPDHLLERGLPAALEADGHDVAIRRIEVQRDFPSEIADSFAVMRAVSGAVSEALGAGAFPLVLAGNCNTTVGTLAGLEAGLGAGSAGVVWLDAHGDFTTPDTSTSGFLDGMGVAILTGRCWQALAHGVPGFRPLADERLVLVGTRDLDEEEAARLARAAIPVVTDLAIQRDGVEQALAGPLSGLSARAETLHLHLDLDVHDAQAAPANHFRPPGGLQPAQVAAVIAAATARLPLGAMAVTAYDPAADPAGVTAAAAIAHVRRALDGAARYAPRGSGTGQV